MRGDPIRTAPDNSVFAVLQRYAIHAMPPVFEQRPRSPRGLCQPRLPVLAWEARARRSDRGPGRVTRSALRRQQRCLAQVTMQGYRPPSADTGDRSASGRGADVSDADVVAEPSPGRSGVS
jgi:hypothetical protein